MNVPVIPTLKRLGACSEARKWAGTFREGTTPEAMWNSCPRSDWLDWLVRHLSIAPELCNQAVYAVARAENATWEATFPNDSRPREAIEALPLEYQPAHRALTQARKAWGEANKLASDTMGRALGYALAGIALSIPAALPKPMVVGLLLVLAFFARGAILCYRAVKYDRAATTSRLAVERAWSNTCGQGSPDAFRSVIPWSVVALHLDPFKTPEDTSP